MPPQSPAPNNEQTPQAEPMPSAAPPQQPAAPITPSQGSSKSRIGLIIGAIVAALLLIGGAYFVYVNYFSPMAKAKKASTSFMQAITTGDKETLYELSEATTDDQKAFLDNAAEKVNGTFSLKEKTSQNDKWYFLYDLSEAQSKTARTEVEEQDGKWLVTGFFHGDDLRLVAQEEPADTPEPVEDTEEPAPNTAVAACITPDDFEKAFEDYDYDNFYHSDSIPLYNNGTFFFVADSTSYEFEDITKGDLTEFANFYTANSTKPMKYILRGDVNESVSTAGGTALANQRAEKLKADLVALGVPESVIEIREPRASNFDQHASSNRAVNGYIVSTCAGQPDPSGIVGLSLE